MKVKTIKSVHQAINAFKKSKEQKFLIPYGRYQTSKKLFVGIRRDRSAALVTYHRKIAEGKIFTNYAARQILSDNVDTSLFHTTYIGFFESLEQSEENTERFKLYLTGEIKRIPYQYLVEIDPKYVKKDPVGIMFKLDEDTVYYLDINVFIDNLMKFRCLILNG